MSDNTNSAALDERALFESIEQARGTDLRKAFEFGRRGEYANPAVQNRWEGWQMARQAAPEAPAQPIYQVQFHIEQGSSAWHDASEAAYHTVMPERRRIVYAAPSIATKETP